jgi:Domain of unknown function (DUF1707)
MARQRDPKLRASDADRDAVAEQLRDHFATGRIRMDELDERLDKVYAAQTYGELEPLIEDLPGPSPYRDLPVPFPATGTGQGSEVAPFQHGWGGELTHGGPAWGAWASASVICWGIWLAGLISGGSVSGFWPVWVSVPWGGVLLAQAIEEHRDHGPGKRRELE